MIINVPGVVLSRKNIGEADRLVVLFTETFGKMTVRFGGVNKPKGKLKALSEPLVWGEYRLYINPRSDIAKAIGGRIIDSFPGLRDDWRRTFEALGCCELLSSLTPDRSPNREKYELICRALTALAGPAPDPWASVAFGLQLLELAGLRPEPASLAPSDRAAFKALGEMDLSGVSGVAWGSDVSSRLRALLYGHAEAQMGRPVKTRLVMDALAC